MSIPRIIQNLFPLRTQKEGLVQQQDYCYLGFPENKMLPNHPDVVFPDYSRDYCEEDDDRKDENNRERFIRNTQDKYKT